MPSSNPDLPIDECSSPGHSSEADIRRATRAIYGWVVGSTLATLVTIFITVVAGSFNELLGILFSTVAVAMLHVWMFVTAIGTVLGPGRSWIWQVFHFTNLVIFSVVFPFLIGMTMRNGHADSELPVVFSASVILFVSCQLVYSAILWIWRFRGYHLSWTNRQNGSTVHLIANRQWNIMDVMMATTLIAILISILGYCYRMMAARDEFFGPFFGLTVLTALGWVSMLLMLVLVLPATLIYLNHDTSTTGKVTRLVIHFVGVVILWFISIGFIQERDFGVLTFILLSLVAMVNFGFQRWIFSGDQSWFPFSLGKNPADTEASLSRRP